MALLADGVSSLLIDGKLTSGSQGTFPTINPATEEVLGAAADAGAEDMDRRHRGGAAGLRRNRLVAQHRTAGAVRAPAA